MDGSEVVSTLLRQDTKTQKAFYSSGHAIRLQSDSSGHGSTSTSVAPSDSIKTGAILLLGTLGLLGIVIIGNFGQVFFLLGITDEKCH